MAILAFQRPENVIMMEATNSFARFEFRPLEPGYGITIGNALRRILLSSLEGYAISCIKIDGVDHEFATIPGVLEDVTNIILNLKQVRFRALSPDAVEETITLEVANTKEFVARALSAKLSSFEVLNPELVICHLDEAYSFTITLTIDKGRGYVPADEKHGIYEDLQILAIDSIYTPIRNVKYFTENYRVGQKTDYEKLVLEVTTDGSIHPEKALRESARILIEHFSLFTERDMQIEEAPISEDEYYETSEESMAQLLKTELKDLDLSVRALNCLQAAQVITLADLVVLQKDDLIKFRNFGKKSQDEIQELMDRMNLQFGMNISKYNLD